MKDVPEDHTEAQPTPLARHSKLGFVVVVVCALAALLWPRSDDARINLEAFRRPAQGQAAPPGMLVDSGGRPTPLASRSAPVTLVHFWSTWCPPCIQEIPSILRLADDYASDHNFALIMIAVQDDVDKASTFLGSRLGEALFDHDWKVSHSFGTKKLPETHLVVNGSMVESFIGATNWDAPATRRVIDDALASIEGG